jgi:hypothetical protein
MLFGAKKNKGKKKYSTVLNMQNISPHCPLLIVLYTEERVCDVPLIKYTLSSGKPKKGWEFGGEGPREQWGTKGVSL